MVYEYHKIGKVESKIIEVDILDEFCHSFVVTKKWINNKTMEVEGFMQYKVEYTNNTVSIKLVDTDYSFKKIIPYDTIEILKYCSIAIEEYID